VKHSIGRTAARRNAPKQPCAIRAGPHSGGLSTKKKLGSRYRGLSDFLTRYRGLFLDNHRYYEFWLIPPQYWAPIFFPHSFGPALMTRGCFGALRLEAAHPIVLRACSATVRFLHSWADCAEDITTYNVTCDS